MARTCGIRIGPRRFELVVLDGSPKKHRITAFQSGEFSYEPDDPVRPAVDALKAAIKDNNVPLDQVGLVVDSGLAAFRMLRLPFDDLAKIEQVIKFEIESQLPQWSIDDVIIDFLPLEKLERETNLIVSAVPKDDLKATIDLCSKAGVEPLDAELETTAMLNAALSADICHLDDAQVLVHIGETSTSVVVVDSGQVRSMRAIHVGALSWEARYRNTTEEDAEEPEENGEAAAEGGAETAPASEVSTIVAPTAEEIDPDELSRHLQQIVARLRRELGRTVSGARTINEIDAVYVCGIELPGLVGSAVMDVPIYVLDVFEEDSGQPAEGTGPLVAAYGAALRRLGGEHVPASLRREELRFTGKFERIELPLAIAALLLATWVAVFWIFEDAQKKWREQDIDDWLMATLDRVEGEPAAGRQAYLQYLYKLTDLKDYIEEIHAERQPDEEGVPPKLRVSPLDRIFDLDDMLGEEVRTLSLDLGDIAEIPQPQSAMYGMTLVLDLLTSLGEDRVGRFSVREIDSSYMRASSSRPDTVRVSMDLTFFGDSYSEAVENSENFKQAIRERGWEFEDVRTTALDGAEGAEGAWMDGFTVTLNLDAEQEGEA